MKKIAYGVAILLTILLGSPAFADYVITLKNGRTVETEKYWEEKGEVKFNWEGGVASIPKKQVVSIKWVKEKFTPRKYPSQDSTAEKEKKELQLEAKKEPQLEARQASPKDAEKSDSSAGFKESEKEFYKKQKAHFTGQFEDAYQRYLEATSRRDEEGKKKAWEEFNYFGGQVGSLETELRKRNNGVVPEWWKE